MNSTIIILNDSFMLDGQTYPLDQIKKVTILNEDAKFTGKTKPFSHQILSGVTMLMPIAGNPVLFVGLRITMNDDTDLYAYISDKKVLIDSDAYFADRKKAKGLMDKLTGNKRSKVLEVERNDPLL